MPFTGVTVTMGIPIPKTPRTWTSLSHITLAIWVRVRAIGEAHIRALFPGFEMGRPTSKAREKRPGDEVGSQGLSFSQPREEERAWEQGILLNYIYISVTTLRFFTKSLQKERLVR